jgi:hypothetical protein
MFVRSRKQWQLWQAAQPAGDVPSAQLADLADCLGFNEMQASQVACLLRQLRGLPAFSSIQEPSPPGMFV